MVLREAGLGERFPCHSLVFRLDINAGERGAGAHSAQQPDAGAAAAGADLDRGPGPDRAGQEASVAPPPGALARCRPGRPHTPGRPATGLGYVLSGIGKWTTRSSLAPDARVRELSGIPGRYLGDTGRPPRSSWSSRPPIRSQLAQRKNPGHDGKSRGNLRPGGRFARGGQGSGIRADTACSARVEPPDVGGHRPTIPLGLPARLPADRQSARRRGSTPGGLRQGLPVAVQLHPRDVRGLAASHHHQPVPGLGPAQAADQVRGPGRRNGSPAARLRAHARRGLR